MKLKIFAFLLGLSVVVLPVAALADDYGLADTAGAAGIGTERTVTQILGDVVGSALSLVSILFFGLMLYAGIKWMLARGDSAQGEEAMNTITYAIIGLVVILASYAITNFVFKSVGGEKNDTTIPEVWCFESPAPPLTGAGICTKLNNLDPDGLCVDFTGGYPDEVACKTANNIE